MFDGVQRRDNEVMLNGERVEWCCFVGGLWDHGRAVESLHESIRTNKSVDKSTGSTPTLSTSFSLTR